ncbi:MAG: CPBP family intramembrane metalloprotease [Cyclobacteriaceae bacterium]|nr:CPBP family intramembrane metalloprotease [Cyclobacteriaceae bacterium]
MKSKLENLFYPLPSYVKRFFEEDFSSKKYLLIAIFLLLAIGINFTVEFETKYVALKEFFPRFIRYIAFYSFAYFGGVLIVRLSGSKKNYLRSPGYWFLSIFAMVVLAFDGSYHGAYDIAKYLVGTSSYVYVGRVLGEVRNLFTILIPLLVVWWFTRKHYESFFGLTLKNVIVKPYMLLLLIMLPLIIIAAQTDSFLESYPMFNAYRMDEKWDIAKIWLVMPYEFFYGSAFLSVELLFRGFLVIGLARFMGKDAILPMVCVYAFLHFEKPMGEAISSVFGGYLLGIFAYYSRNIWGGVFVHAGIALMMEAVAALAKM